MHRDKEKNAEMTDTILRGNELRHFIEQNALQKPWKGIMKELKMSISDPWFKSWFVRK